MRGAESCLWGGSDEHEGDEEEGSTQAGEEAWLPHDCAPAGAEDDESSQQLRDSNEDGGQESQRHTEGENDDETQPPLSERGGEADDDAGEETQEEVEGNAAASQLDDDAPVADELLGEDDFEGQALMHEDVPAEVVIKRIERLTEVRSGSRAS